jgi:hypothetical protein
MANYTLEMRDDAGCTETREIVAASAAEAVEQIQDEADDWCSDGDWGVDGASVVVSWSLSEDGDEIDNGSCTVDIEPDHAALIQQACGYIWDESGKTIKGCGENPDDHDWTSEGEGGCIENPGVWSTGGTSMSFASHCRKCGLHRSEHDTGSQRNPGDHDTVSYEMPESWCAECQSAECSCETYTLEMRGDDADGKVIAEIGSYTACVFGPNGDQPGEVEIVLESCLVETESGEEAILYRWAERDGSHETGEWINDKATAIEGGEEYAELNDEEPDTGSIVTEIEETGFFEDNDIIPHVIKAATKHSQGYLLVTPDIGQPIGTMWTTNGYLQRDDYITLDATFSKESYAADALLRAIQSYQSGDDE